jgi:uracil-DNA glycosylase family 4
MPVSDASRRLQYLEAMGIQTWVTRDASPAAVADPAPDYVVAEPGAMVESGDVAGLDWDALRARVKDCALCGLSMTRAQTVFGVGNRSATWMVIGEAPGAEEDKQGEPFVGRAGQLLNEMLWALGLERGAVYIANVLKCRPPGNRDPNPDEVACCEPYLKRQVALIKPKIILAVGRIAAQNLLKTNTRIGALRGRVHRYADSGIPLVVTYHPAYLLRSPLEKRKAWEDLQLAARTLNESAG